MRAFTSSPGVTFWSSRCRSLEPGTLLGWAGARSPGVGRSKEQARSKKKRAVPGSRKKGPALLHTAQLPGQLVVVREGREGLLALNWEAE